MRVENVLHCNLHQSSSGRSSRISSTDVLTKAIMGTFIPLEQKIIATKNDI